MPRSGQSMTATPQKFGHFIFFYSFFWEASHLRDKKLDWPHQKKNLKENYKFLVWRELAAEPQSGGLWPFSRWPPDISFFLFLRIPGPSVWCREAVRYTQSRTGERKKEIRNLFKNVGANAQCRVAASQWLLCAHRPTFFFIFCYFFVRDLISK